MPSADIRSKCADNRSGSGQKTSRKEIEGDRLLKNVRQRAGGFTAIDGLRTERVCADYIQDVRRQRSQTTEVSAKSKCAVSVLSVLCQCVVTGRMRMFAG